MIFEKMNAAFALIDPRPIFAVPPGILAPGALAHLTSNEPELAPQAAAESPLMHFFRARGPQTTPPLPSPWAPASSPSGAAQPLKQEQGECIALPQAVLPLLSTNTTPLMESRPMPSAKASVEPPCQVEGAAIVERVRPPAEEVLLVGESAEQDRNIIVIDPAEPILTRRIPGEATLDTRAYLDHLRYEAQPGPSFRGSLIRFLAMCDHLDEWPSFPGQPPGDPCTAPCSAQLPAVVDLAKERGETPGTPSSIKSGGASARSPSSPSLAVMRRSSGRQATPPLLPRQQQRVPLPPQLKMIQTASTVSQSVDEFMQLKGVVTPRFSTPPFGGVPLTQCDASNCHLSPGHRQLAETIRQHCLEAFRSCKIETHLAVVSPSMWPTALCAAILMAFCRQTARPSAIFLSLNPGSADLLSALFCAAAPNVKPALVPLASLQTLAKVQPNEQHIFVGTPSDLRRAMEHEDLTQLRLCLAKCEMALITDDSPPVNQVSSSSPLEADPGSQMQEVKPLDELRTTELCAAATLLKTLFSRGANNWGFAAFLLAHLPPYPELGSFGALIGAHRTSTCPRGDTEAAPFVNRVKIACSSLDEPLQKLIDQTLTACRSLIVQLAAMEALPQGQDLASLPSRKTCSMITELNEHLKENPQIGPCRAGGPGLIMTSFSLGAGVDAATRKMQASIVSALIGLYCLQRVAEFLQRDGYFIADLCVRSFEASPLYAKILKGCPAAQKLFRALRSHLRESTGSTHRETVLRSHPKFRALRHLFAEYLEDFSAARMASPLNIGAQCAVFCRTGSLVPHIVSVLEEFSPRLSVWTTSGTPPEGAIRAEQAAGDVKPEDGTLRCYVGLAGPEPCAQMGPGCFFVFFDQPPLAEPFLKAFCSPQCNLAICCNSSNAAPPDDSTEDLIKAIRAHGAPHHSRASVFLSAISQPLPPQQATAQTAPDHPGVGTKTISRNAATSQLSLGPTAGPASFTVPLFLNAASPLLQRIGLLRSLEREGVVLLERTMTRLCVVPVPPPTPALPSKRFRDRPSESDAAPAFQQVLGPDLVLDEAACMFFQSTGVLWAGDQYRPQEPYRALLTRLTGLPFARCYVLIEAPMPPPLPPPGPSSLATPAKRHPFEEAPFRRAWTDLHLDIAALSRNSDSEVEPPRVSVQLSSGAPTETVSLLMGMIRHAADANPRWGKSLETWGRRPWLREEETPQERFLAAIPGMTPFTAQLLLSLAPTLAALFSIPLQDLLLRAPWIPPAAVGPPRLVPPNEKQQRLKDDRSIRNGIPPSLPSPSCTPRERQA
ncbi:hypothetical protein PAPYR_9745 [Paratrimastix pyriformis]|uniref:Uncharacterized protein n=1 Tax=Paratrimastix pyriformis TaxID=342808 RepID=A0ABQ8U7N9_9EUKA|nr:hypothetical protein PAPYR_9745 [Paratrimastix pyriformis]